MNAPALRARSAGEILDTAFQLYRSRWKQMAAATGVLLLPLMLLQAAVPESALGLVDRLSNLFYLFASAAVVVIASGAYMGRDVEAVDAVRAVGRRMLSVWGAAIMQSILLLLGFIALVIPVFIVAAWTFAMQQAVMIEGASAGESFDRSRALAKGHFWHIMATGVLTTIIALCAVLGVGLLLEMVVPGLRVFAILLTLATIVINPIAAVVGTVLYYDLRIRKEAFDVVVATDRLKIAEPVPAA